jgi:ABC-type branched-subunit amino acid transport system substrate-binding protein
MATPKFIETAAEAAEGVYFTTPYPGNDANDTTRAFAAAYKERWGEDPEFHGANTYGTGHHKKMFAKASEIFSAEEYAGSLEQFETIFPMRGYREALARLGRGV